MHSRTCSGGTTFFFHGDLSGELHITNYTRDEDDTDNNTVIIPAKDIIELIARELVLNNMIGKLENSEDDFLIEHLLQNLH